MPISMLVELNSFFQNCYANMTKERLLPSLILQELDFIQKRIYALRASNIDSLVYVSCDAKAAMNNFIDLGRMTSKAYKGDPFVPKKVIPVDLFPHTNHFELIIYFERFPLKKSLKCEETE